MKHTLYFSLTWQWWALYPEADLFDEITYMDPIAESVGALRANENEHLMPPTGWVTWKCSFSWQACCLTKPREARLPWRGWRCSTASPHPMTRWLVSNMQNHTVVCVALKALSVMLPIFPYMPCLSFDSDIKSNLRRASALYLGLAACFFLLTFDDSSTEEAHGCSSCPEDCPPEALSQGNSKIYFNP